MHLPKYLKTATPAVQNRREGLLLHCTYDDVWPKCTKPWERTGKQKNTFVCCSPPLCTFLSLLALSNLISLPTLSSRLWRLRGRRPTLAGWGQSGFLAAQRRRIAPMHATLENFETAPIFLHYFFLFFPRRQSFFNSSAIFRRAFRPAADSNCKSACHPFKTVWLLYLQPTFSFVCRTFGRNFIDMSARLEVAPASREKACK